MNNHKVLATFVVAILVASAFAVASFRSGSLPQASAQSVTITTSGDSHNKRFFGEGALQVVITDPNKDDDNTQETIQVDIDADPETGASVSGTFTVPETSDSSSKFEFFLMQATADDVAVAALDPINTNDAAEYTGANTEAPVIRFGAGEELPVTTGLFDDVSFDITVGDEQITVKYEDSPGDLTLDRSTYGGDSIIHMFITDQDANKDPTNVDTYTVTAADLNAAVFDLQGATFDDDVTFRETGDNTAKFEAELQIASASSATDDEIVVTDESVQATLNDRANYDDPTNTTINDSQDTSSRSFTIDNADGELDDIGALTFGSELKLTLTDNDQNKDSEDDERLTDRVTVSVDNAGGDVEFLDMKETDDNTGTFVIDLSNNELPITFLADGQNPTLNNSKLELRQDDITEDILIEYTDPLDDNDASSVTSSFTTQMTLATGTVDVPDAAGINDDFVLTVTDPDLNDNPRTRDSYTFVLNDVGPYELKKAGNPIGDMATLEFQIEGDDVDFGTQSITYTLVETDINSGIFTTELDMQDFLDFGNNGGALTVNDGDTFEVTYNDLMGTTSRESTDDLAIGEANTGVDFSRTVLPIPPEAGSATADVGTEVTTTLIVTDPDSNTGSTSEETIPFTIGTDENEFSFDIDGDGFSFTVDGSAGHGVNDDMGAGASLSDILDIPTSVSETGKSTGVFDEDLTFINDGSMSTDDWNDMKITITYVDAQGDEESAGITFRSNDGSVTVDQNSAKSGTNLVITVEDQDLNLDDTEAEEFQGTDASVGSYLLAVETEDDEIPGIQDQTFRETGPDTGVFTAEYVVGTDIPITELQNNDDKVNQATNILITYNDEVDSSGGSGDEIEVNVPVVTSTGAITVTPELVGPGTTMTVIITDSDLDEDARSTDNYDTPDPNSDNFFVSFRSDRTEVGRASPDIEETGPNTGVFTFDIELITDEKDCEDDDLGASKYDAQGGSDPQIGACPGDLISIKYEDEQDASGRSTAVSAIVEVKSWDPEFASDKPSYNVGDRVTVTISDPDANRDADVADSLTDIRVFSDTDRVGEELSALETGRDTGVFRLSFGTSSSTAGGAITVKTGDDLTVQYTDAFPADFSDQENDKDFTFVVPIGAGGGGPGSTTPSEPEVKDLSGGKVDTITTGQQVVLTTSVVNNVDSDLPFVALVEVRDASGITVYLAWQTGTLPVDGRSEVGLSWTPDAPGSYSVRTFVISSLTNPQVLSDVKTTTITVS